MKNWSCNNTKSKSKTHTCFHIIINPTMAPQVTLNRKLVCKLSCKLQDNYEWNFSFVHTSFSWRHSILSNRPFPYRAWVSLWSWLWSIVLDFSWHGRDAGFPLSSWWPFTRLRWPEQKNCESSIWGDLRRYLNRMISHVVRNPNTTPVAISWSHHLNFSILWSLRCLARVLFSWRCYP